MKDLKESKTDKGLRGEKIASKILKDLGFKEIWQLLDSDNRASSYDILAVRWNQRYAINVKFGKMFAINSGNLKRLNNVYKKHDFKPAFLFIESSKTFWFYSLDINFPQKIDNKNNKSEMFE